LQAAGMSAFGTKIKKLGFEVRGGLGAGDAAEAGIAVLRDVLQTVRQPTTLEVEPGWMPGHVGVHPRYRTVPREPTTQERFRGDVIENAIERLVEITERQEATLQRIEQKSAGGTALVPATVDK
ncbi:unnamed protein product, partial [marine sediment metagenome]